ncbi:WD repeat domain 65 [Perkinsus chesapeaki]|uniref:WD repeat domain 65 n=1 Tax=Perkinsus chesapeaki TaxID=330153 RepID=A0A7J6N010_PERCH|nr:WD repeat domain 65 [Perkinsus chesapeaki]
MRSLRNDDFYDPKHPLLLLKLNSLDRLSGASNDIVQVAKDLGASIAILERRYTGESLPTKEFSVETLSKLFIMPQILRDVAFVGENIKSSVHGIRVIVFGCSSSGTIAAMARKNYPYIFDGAIVSSAPLKFQLEMPEYAEVIGKDFSNPDLGGSSQCLTALQEAHSAIGEKLASPEGRRQLEKTFDLHGGNLEVPEVQKYFSYLGRLTGTFIQYNDPSCKEEYCNIRKICSKLATGGASPLDRLAIIYKASTPESDLTAVLKRTITTFKDKMDSSKIRMLQFRACFERGLFATCNSAACPLYTGIANGWLDFQVWLCREGFGISKGDVLEVLGKYVGNFRSTTNILSINGDADPWYPSSIFKEGEGPEVEMVRGASHCYWCEADDDATRKVLERIRKVIQKMRVEIRKMRLITAQRSAFTHATHLAYDQTLTTGWLAVAERLPKEAAAISVFDLVTSKKVKALPSVNCELSAWSHMEFSGDGRYLVGLSAPQGDSSPPGSAEGGRLASTAEGLNHTKGCKLACWGWEGDSVPSIVDLLKGYPPESKASPTHLSFCESDSLKVCVTGRDYVAVYHIAEDGTLTAAVSLSAERQGGSFFVFLVPVREQLTCMPRDYLTSGQAAVDLNGDTTIFPAVEITSHLWPEADTIICGTLTGKLLLFDEFGLFKQTLIINSTVTEGAYRLMISWSKGGFMAAGDDGKIRMFRKNHDDPEEVRPTKIESIALSPSEDFLAAVTDCGQLLSISLRSAKRLLDELLLDNGRGESKKQQFAKWMLCSFHTGPIYGMDICPRRPIIATCGSDHTIRLWNFQQRRCELIQHFVEEAYSISLHPSGLQALVGFVDRLRLMDVLKEEFKTYKDFPQIKGCRECRFSNGGHLFAAANGNNIEIFKTYTCERILSLKGHNNRIRALCWNWDDTRLISAGMDGAVYEYDVINNGQRLSDWVNKSSIVSSAAVWTDTSAATNGGPCQNSLPVTRVFAVGNVSSIREVYLSQVQSSIEDAPEPRSSSRRPVHFGQICLGNSTKTLFVSTSSPDFSEVLGGSVRCYKFPFITANENDDKPSRSKVTAVFSEHSCHFGEVTRMRVSADEKLLFTCGEDGSVYVFEIRNKNPLLSIKQGNNKGKSGGTEEMPYSEEVLVTKALLDERQQQLKDLRRQVEELANQTDYQLRHRDSYHAERMAELEDKFAQALQRQKERYSILKEEKNVLQGEYEEKLRGVLEAQKSEAQQVETSYQEKIVAKVTKYQQLAYKRHEDHRKWKAMHKELLDMHERKVADLRDQYQDHEARDQQHKQQVDDERALAMKVHGETVRQLEQDAAGEVRDLRKQYEQMLSYERDDKVKLRGEAGIHRKHHEDLKKQMIKKEEEIRGQQEEAGRRQDRIDELMAAREKTLKDIKEQDKMIGEKEHKIYDLKKQNQELEKFKFILDHKIKELKEQVGPKDHAIAEMKKQISDMDHDLEEYHKQNKHLMEDIKQMRIRQKELQEEVVRNRQKLSDLRRVSAAFKTDLYHTTQHILEPVKLRESFTALAKKYAGVSGEDEAPKDDDKKGEDVPELSDDIMNEYERQRGHLEAKVNKLKRRLESDAAARKKENAKIMGENIALLREIGELRKNLQTLELERQEKKLGVSGRGASSTRGRPAGLQKQSEAARKAAKYAKEIEENRQTIAELREKIKLIAAEELSTLHSLVAKKAADVSARERSLLHRQSAMGAEIMKAQQMIQELAARLILDAQGLLNSTSAKLTKRLEGLLGRVSSMVKEARLSAADRRERDLASAAMKEELKSLKSRIVSYKSASNSAREECDRLKKAFGEMSSEGEMARNQASASQPSPPQSSAVEVQALKARIATLKTAAGAAKDECQRLKGRLEEAKAEADRASSTQMKLRKKVAELEAQNRAVRDEIVEVEHRAAEHSLAEVERLTRHLDGLENENQRLRFSVEELQRRHDEASQQPPHMVSTATSPAAASRDKREDSPRLLHGVSLFEASFAEDSTNSRGTTSLTLLTTSLPHFNHNAAAAIGALIVLTSSEMDAALLSKVASVINRAITSRLCPRRGSEADMEYGPMELHRPVSIIERAKRRMLQQRLGPSLSVTRQPSRTTSRDATVESPIDVLQYATGSPDARRVTLAALSHLNMPEDDSARMRLFTDAGLQEFIAAVMADQVEDPACQAVAVALGTRSIVKRAEDRLSAQSSMKADVWGLLVLLTVKYDITALQSSLTVTDKVARNLTTEILRTLIESSVTSDFSRRILSGILNVDATLLQPLRSSIMDLLAVVDTTE